MPRSRRCSIEGSKLWLALFGVAQWTDATVFWQQDFVQILTLLQSPAPKLLAQPVQRFDIRRSRCQIIQFKGIGTNIVEFFARPPPITTNHQRGFGIMLRKLQP